MAMAVAHAHARVRRGLEAPKNSRGQDSLSLDDAIAINTNRGLEYSSAESISAGI